MAKSNKRNPGQLGCGFILSTGLVLILLLVGNAFLVRTFFRSNLSSVDDRIFQAAQFVLPIIMIAIEYWIYDQIANRKKMPRNDD